jgi:hypothetical protein
MPKSPGLEDALKAADAIQAAVDEFHRQVTAYEFGLVPFDQLRPCLDRMREARRRLEGAVTRMSQERPH